MPIYMTIAVVHVMQVGSWTRRLASINNQTEIVNGERGHYLVWSVRVKG